MPEPIEKAPATVPEQPEAKPPLRKSMPVVVALVVIIGLIGIANLTSLLSGNRKNPPASAMPMRPAAPNAQQVNSFESQQQLRAVILRELRCEPAPDPSLAEILGVRLLLVNVLRPLAAGQSMSIEGFDKLLDQISTLKHEMAGKLLAEGRR